MLVIVGLTVRCVLLSRPPVSTLYETIVFITGGAVLVALIATVAWVPTVRGPQWLPVPLRVEFGQPGLELLVG